MSVAAVVLDHHWIVDVVIGWGYCLAAYALVSFVVGRALGAARSVDPVPFQVRST